MWNIFFLKLIVTRSTTSCCRTTSKFITTYMMLCVRFSKIWQQKSKSGFSTQSLDIGSFLSRVRVSANKGHVRESKLFYNYNNDVLIIQTTDTSLINRLKEGVEVIKPHNLSPPPPRTRHCTNDLWTRFCDTKFGLLSGRCHR